MALFKLRDMASIPDGLCRVAQDTVKGSAVIRKVVEGKEVLALPTTLEEATAFSGFVTLDIEYNEHKGSYYDTIKKGELAVMYTRVPMNEWKTTEFVGEFKIGDKACIGFTDENDKGKVIKASPETNATLEVVGVIPAMGGYEKAMVAVRILP